MGTPQVKLAVNLSSIPFKSKVSKEGSFSFSEALKVEETEGQRSNPRLSQEGRVQKRKEERFYKEPKELRTKDSEFKASVADETQEISKKKTEVVGETDTTSPISENIMESQEILLKPSEEEVDENTEILMGLLQQFLSDLALKIGSKEEIKEFLSTYEGKVSDLLDINTWKEFLLDLNGLSEMTEMLTNNKASMELGVISDLLESVLNSGEMKQITAGLTEGSVEFDEMMNRLEKAIAKLGKPETKSLPKESTAVEGEALFQTEEISPISEGKGETGFKFAKKGGGEQRELNLKSTEVNALSPNTGNRLFDHLISGIKALDGSSPLTEGLRSAEILEQVTNHIKSLQAPDKMTLEVLLRPETLGKVFVQVTSKNGVMQAHLRVESQEARNALVNQIVDLKTAFENRGFKVEEIEVMLSEAGIGNGSDEQSSENQAGKHKNRGNRKMNFEALDEEVSSERIASELYSDELSGGSVNYMA